MILVTEWSSMPKNVVHVVGSSHLSSFRGTSKYSQECLIASKLRWQMSNSGGPIVII